jgi:hypothetical protein
MFLTFKNNRHGGTEDTERFFEMILCVCAPLWLQIKIRHRGTEDTEMGFKEESFVPQRLCGSFLLQSFRYWNYWMGSFDSLLR